VVCERCRRAARGVVLTRRPWRCLLALLSPRPVATLPSRCPLALRLSRGPCPGSVHCSSLRRGVRMCWLLGPVGFVLCALVDLRTGFLFVVVVAPRCWVFLCLATGCVLSQAFWLTCPFCLSLCVAGSLIVLAARALLAACSWRLVVDCLCVGASRLLSLWTVGTCCGAAAAVPPWRACFFTPAVGW